MARSPKLYFDHSFILYYIVYDYWIVYVCGCLGFLNPLLHSSYYNDTQLEKKWLLDSTPSAPKIEVILAPREVNFFKLW